MKKNISTFVFGILLTTSTLSFSTAIKAQAITSQKTNGSAITEQVLKDILEKNVLITNREKLQITFLNSVKQIQNLLPYL